MLTHRLRWLLIFLLTASAHAQRLSALAPVPDWGELERFQETITHDEFVHLLGEIYAPHDAARGLIEIADDAATIRKTLEPVATWTLHFAKAHATGKPAPHEWRAISKLPPGGENTPLAGSKIALDPGHLGGEWAHMEERWYKIGESLPVTEGDMTLLVAKLLAPRLRALGAEVVLVRDAAGPTSSSRPDDFREAARAQLALRGVEAPRENYSGDDDPKRGDTIQFESEILFYRTHEIRHRAELVNRELKPDLTVCLHFNAEAWGDPNHPGFVPRNHLHTIVNGCYSAEELGNDDVRFDMLVKLLSRTFSEELPASESVAKALAKATGLPPYVYPRDNAIRVGASTYVWARNLLANRLYRTPVIFLEPYVMNSQEVWERVQAGDYDGEKIVTGAMRKSIYREYADAVAAGLAEYARAAR